MKKILLSACLLLGCITPSIAGTNILASARQLTLGHTMEAGDIVIKSYDTPPLNGLSDPSRVIGKVLRYSVGAGQSLNESMLRDPYSVIQGGVPVFSQGKGFYIKSEGVALSNASEGQSVQVRIGSRVVSGTVRNGMVELGQ